MVTCTTSTLPSASIASTLSYTGPSPFARARSGVEPTTPATSTPSRRNASTCTPATKPVPMTAARIRACSFPRGLGQRSARPSRAIHPDPAGRRSHVRRLIPEFAASSGSRARTFATAARSIRVSRSSEAVRPGQDPRPPGRRARTCSFAAAHASFPCSANPGPDPEPEPPQPASTTTRAAGARSRTAASYRKLRSSSCARSPTTRSASAANTDAGPTATARLTSAARAAAIPADVVSNDAA